MEFCKDFKFWSLILAGLSFVGIVIGNIVNKLTSDKIANNHLSHIAEDVKDIAKSQKKQGEIINEVKIDVAYLKGQQGIKDNING